MSDTEPHISIIIAARPEQSEILALDASRRLDYPAGKLEIIVARGQQPSAQRNAAVRQARGDFVYFLDDDSEPVAGNLRRAVAHYRAPEVEVVGGPNLCPVEAPALEQSFAAVLGSWLAFGPSRARYLPTGQARESGEKELILCNLIMRRATFSKLGGFDESLYPNEENALMDAIKTQGGKLIYDPEFSVRRRPRKTVNAFIKMLMNYGRGRAEQFRLHPTGGSLLNFAPAAFCLYLPLALALGRWWLAPLVLYGLGVLAQSLIARAPNGKRYGLTAPLIFLTHLFYGLGFWRGMFTTLPPRRDAPMAPIRLEVS